MMPQLLCYHALDDGPLKEPVWVAIVEGSAAEGGEGLTVWGGSPPDTHTSRRGTKPGEVFLFGSNNNLGRRVVREVWGLDAVPQEVAAAWVKYRHLGRIPA